MSDCSIPSQSAVSSQFNGALLVDKPTGITSAQVVRVLKRTFRFRKIGHAGTLDPLATGLLPILCGEATKLQDVLVDAPKEYEGTIELGRSTATDDIEGDLLYTDERENVLADYDADEVTKLLKERFMGTFEQLPPAYSALKVNGARSYDLARKGIKPKLKPRPVTIHSSSFELVESNIIAFRILCSKGTYIRAIARDSGELLGTHACLRSLRRTKTAGYDVNQATILDVFEKRAPKECSVVLLSDLASILPRIDMNELDCEMLRLGNQTPLENIEIPISEQSSDMAALFESGGALVAIICRNADSDNSDYKLRNSWRIRCVFHPCLG